MFKNIVLLMASVYCGLAQAQLSDNSFYTITIKMAYDVEGNVAQWEKIRNAVNCLIEYCNKYDDTKNINSICSSITVAGDTLAQIASMIQDGSLLLKLSMSQGQAPDAHEMESFCDAQGKICINIGLQFDEATPNNKKEDLIGILSALAHDSSGDLTSLADTIKILAQAMRESFYGNARLFISMWE